MARTRYRIYDPSAPHFLTATTVHWLPLFSRPEHAFVVLQSLRFLHEADAWTLYAYVLMEHHLHWIAQANDLVRTVQRFKSYTARRIIDTLQQRKARWMLGQLAHARPNRKTDQHYQVWQEGHQPKQIRGGAMLWQKIDYIHQNPVKRGYVDDPTHWRYSSARDYTGTPGLVPVSVVEKV